MNENDLVTPLRYNVIRRIIKVIDGILLLKLIDS